jgi:hypothetical protein
MLRNNGVSPYPKRGCTPLARNFQHEFGDIIQPMTESQNFSGKAYTIKEGESLIGWLQRGSREHGEAREKFKKTIFGNVRMAMKIRATGGIFEVPEPTQLSMAYESVRVRAVELTRQAGLDAWASELIMSAVQAAYATLVYGPNMADLVVDRLLTLIQTGLSVADASAEATRWVQDQIVAAKVAPNNPFGDDDEAIAAAILAKILAERAGPDPKTFSIDT